MSRNELQSVGARNEAFTRWAKKQGLFLHPDISFLTPTKTMGMGVFARCALSPKTVVASCPMAVALSPYAEASPLTPSIAVLRGDSQVVADAVVFVVLRLMAERCRANSPWRAWLEVCPSMESHLFALTARQSALLGCSTHACWGEPSAKDGATRRQCSGSSTWHDAQSLTSHSCSNRSVNTRGAVEEEDEAVGGDDQDDDIGLSWTHVSQQLNELHVARRWAIAQSAMSSHREIWPAKQATYALFCECLAHVYSRNFHREEVREREGPYLVPGLDMLNHSRTPNALLQVRGGTRRNELCFTVVTTRALQAHEQVYISYGHIGVARFVVEFQFVTPSVLAEDMIRFSTDTLVSLVMTMRGYCAHTSRPDSPNSHRTTTVLATSDRVMCDGTSRSTAHHADTPAKDTSTKETVLADVVRRVEYLQRMGMLYDEGLYLCKMPLSLARSIRHACVSHRHAATPAAIPDYLTELAQGQASVAPTDEAEESELDSTTRAKRAAEALSSLQIFANVMYLLMIDCAAFDTAYRTITRDWVCVWGENVMQWTQVALRLRYAAAERQDGAIDAAFDVSAERGKAATSAQAADGDGCDTSHAKANKTPSSAARSRLLHAALESEMSVLAQYSQLLTHLRDLYNE